MGGGSAYTYLNSLCTRFSEVNRCFNWNITTGSFFTFRELCFGIFLNESFERTSNTFRDRIHLFSKVYFPRIIMPLSLLVTNFFRCLIQLSLLVIIIAYYAVFKGFSVKLDWLKIGFPLAIIFTGLISLALGLLVSVITAKYRDLGNLISICIRLLMFVTPVFYPLSSVKPELQWIVELNPLTSFFELFRLGLLGEGTVRFSQFIYSFLFMTIALVLALYLFNRRGQKLIDVI